MTIGRNDPCPCGSGRKYKKCHGAGQAAATLASLQREDVRRSRVLKDAEVKLSERLMRMARRVHGPDWLSDELQSCGLLTEAGTLPDAELAIVIPWLEHMALGEHGVPLADELRVREGRRLSDDELLLLDAFRSAWMSVWEVAEVERGVGSHLVDRLTGEKRFVLDVLSSETLQPLENVLAIVLDCDGVSFFGGVHAQPLPPRAAEWVVSEARRACRVRTRPVRVERLREEGIQLELLDMWSVVVEDLTRQPLPSLQNTDGDAFVLTKDVFTIAAPMAAVIDRLRSLPDAEGPEKEGGETVFVVGRPAASGQRGQKTLTARIAVSSDRLVIETNSARRAESMRVAVQSQLGDLARFRVREEQNMAQLMAEARARVASGTPRERKEMEPALAAAAREFRQRYMARWIDDVVPALGGITPREAVTTKRGRAQVEALLRDFEWREGRLPEAERIDYGAVREALGLTKDE